MLTNPQTNPQPAPQHCTPDACPECMLPKNCDCETNLASILEAADQYSAAMALLNDVFGKYKHCGLKEMGIGDGVRIEIQVVERRLLDLVPGPVQFVARDDSKDFAGMMVKQISPSVQLTCLVRHEYNEVYREGDQEDE